MVPSGCSNVGNIEQKMNFLRKNRGGARSGFTLIELLVVIAIIGVLASIVLASLNNARKKSRDARRITDVRQIQLALELYFDGQSSKYPPASTTCDATANAYGLEALVTGGYIPQISRDPSAATTCYKYATPAAPATTYHLGAKLEDSGNPAFNGDKDCTSAAAGCGAAAYTNGFDGTTDGTNLYYDLIP